MKQLLNTLFVLTEDAYCSTENDNVVVQQHDKVLAKVPLRSLEAILLFTYKGASPSLLGRCAEFGVGVSFYSPRGRYYCSILSEKNRNVLLRREQFRIADDENAALPFARSFITGKVYNERWVIERTKRDHAMRVNEDRLSSTSHNLQTILADVQHCESTAELRGFEGTAAKNYFAAFDDLILREKDIFYFRERSRRPPLDQMNALLSFVYTLLSGDCVAALQGVGWIPMWDSCIQTVQKNLARFGSDGRIPCCNCGSFCPHPSQYRKNQTEPIRGTREWWCVLNRIRQENRVISMAEP